MKIKAITLRNFRCFGESPVTVDLSENLTALVGGNGSGKTALLMALTRLFGPTQNSRTIRRSDFHLPLGTAAEDLSIAELAIEIVLTFPELAEDAIPSEAVPSTFRHMIVDAPGGEPICRIRLDATWSYDGTSEGNVDQILNWVLPGDENVYEEKLQRMAPYERGLIQVHYIPANRDPAPELRGAARSRIGRLVRAISWKKSTRDTVQEASEKIGEVLSNEQTVDAINRFLSQRWDTLRDDQVAAGTNLRFAGSGFDEIIRGFGVVFHPKGDSIDIDLSELSEGQQSLFYLALVAAVFDIERQVTVVRQSKGINKQCGNSHHEKSEHAESTNDDHLGFKEELLSIPALTIFEIEEPENHLAPHYLARIVALLRSLAETGRVQGLFSSHSPSVMRRVFPEEIRHLHLDKSTRKSSVKRITMPESAGQASKFVREAVIAYPELYFGKFIILAEGPSEEIVLPKIASSLGIDIDRSFVCVVPLGGRHVNHFWRLLTDLEIPYATLLDLDAGRPEGGWARIKYVLDQLLRVGTCQSELLEFQYDEGSLEISLEELSSLHNKEISDFKDFTPWINHLEKFNVFFSGPLDFDLSLLRRLPEAYMNIEGLAGPNIPFEGSSNREQYFRSAIESAVGSDETAVELYLAYHGVKELFPWYRYLFLSRSKPSTHLLALAEKDGGELKDKAPPPLKRLLQRCESELSK